MQGKRILIVTIIMLLAACAPTPSLPTATPSPSAPSTILPVARSSYHFVTDRLQMPVTQAQAQQFALDVDGDGQPDNLFGQALAALVGLDPQLDFQSEANEAVTAGPVFILHDLQAGDIQNSTQASWSIFLGQSSQSPLKLDGSDQFTLDPSAPLDSHIAGAISNGHFSGGPGTARVRTRFMGQLIDLDLIGVHLEADVSAAQCTNGRLAGGLSQAQFRAKVLPAIADGLNQVIAAGGSTAQALRAAFDTDGNGTVSTQELEGNLLLKSAFSPDLDLLDANGQFNPRQDGVKDSFSAAFGFSCVAATFSAPGE